MSSSLVITEPMAMTDAMMIASNLPEEDYPEWDSTATYALGDRVMITAVHSVYESPADGNTGNDPQAPATLKWALVGATNRWKAFDDALNTQALTAGGESPSISYQIRPGRAVTSVGVLNVINAASMRIRMIDPAYGTVYDKTTALRPTPASPGWWQWFFGVRRGKTQHLADDLPSFPTADIHIDLMGGAALAVGVIVLGQQRRFGLGVEYGARVGMAGYSGKTRDTFGRLLLKKRLASKRNSVTLFIRREEVDELNRYLGELDAVPCLFAASTMYESLSVYGIISRFDILIAYPDYSICELETEGLI